MGVSTAQEVVVAMGQELLVVMDQVDMVAIKGVAVVVMVVDLDMVGADTVNVNVTVMEIEAMIGMKVTMVAMVIGIQVEAVIVMVVEALLDMKESIESARGHMIVQVVAAVLLLMMTVIRMSLFKNEL